MLPDLNLAEGEGLNYDALFKCHVVVAHTVGQFVYPSKYVEPTFLDTGSPEGLFKWVLSDSDDYVRSEGLQALSQLAIKVRLHGALLAPFSVIQLHLTFFTLHL